jgi:hypothetical protein
MDDPHNRRVGHRSDEHVNVLRGLVHALPAALGIWAVIGLVIYAIRSCIS